MPPSEYLMVLPVQHFRTSASEVAVESAFAEHLRMMVSRIGSSGEILVIASPQMRTADYESRKAGLSVINEQKDGIRFSTLYAEDSIRSAKDKIRAVTGVMRTIHSLAKRSFCVHSGLSWDVLMPYEFASIVFGILLKRRTVFVVDIDYRKSAWMSYKAGGWSWKSYILCRYVYDAARSLQVAIAARYCTVVLLKGRKMAADFGSAGRTNVKSFVDASHSGKNIIDDASLARKLAAIRDKSQPIRITYFGRLTSYKGIDRCLRAVAMAHQAGANVRLEIVGGGEQMEELRRLTNELQAESFVEFLGTFPFDQQFFHLLYQFHLLLAAPLREDTPRSALDAMAAGIPYLAFDTYYYQELLESGAGRTVPWPDVDAMAKAIVELEASRETLAGMAENAVAYGRANTQEIWLERRFEWTLPSTSVVEAR